MKTYIAKITSNGRSIEAWQLEAKSYANAKLTAKVRKENKGIKGLLSVASVKPRKDLQKIMFPFSVDIYRLDIKGNEILTENEANEMVPQPITFDNLQSKTDAISEGHKHAPTIGCMGYKLVVSDQGEEIFCESYKF